MKICFASLRFDDKLSGQTNSIKNIIKEISKFHDVHILGLADSKKKNQFLKDINHFLGIFRFIRHLRKNVDNYDIIHLQLPTPAFSIVGDLIKTKVKIIVQFDSIVIDEPLLKILKMSLKYDFFFYFFRILFNNKYITRLLSRFKADHYVVASQYQKDQLVNDFRISSNRISQIPNFVDDKFVRIDKKRARKIFGFKQSDFIITYIGHILHHKGIYDVVKSFKKRKNAKGSQTSKLIIASSNLGNLNRIKKMNVPNIIYFGKINVAHLLSASDVLHVSYVYSFGTSWYPSILLEALKVGIRTMTTDIPLTREIIKGGKTFNQVSKKKSIQKLINVYDKQKTIL